LADQTSAEQEVGLVDSRIRETSSVTAEVERLTEEMKALQEEESSINRVIEEIKRSTDALSSQLSSKRADYERVREQQDKSQPVIARVNKAERIAIMLETLIQELYPLKVRDVADAMTTTYKALAHKKLLDHIRISDDCQVSLMDRLDNDIRRFDPSAGENQIFAISLISAIAQVSEIEIPMVVDTPLARLDEIHRLNVLDHWANQPGQVILLSATDEVSGSYYKSIEEKLSVVYHLSYEELEEGIGNTHVETGYWRKR
jgi:DNA sulfur modification protein DndD